MESKQELKIPFFISLLLLGFARCDIDKDKERCANNLVGLAPCLEYVSGESRAPPIDCCTGFTQVLQKSPECICILVKDRNDPSLGLTINATLALGLPEKCHVPSNTPANISNCPALLHLAPNSPDAKVFEDFGNNGNNAPAPSPADVANSRGRSVGAAGRAAGGSSNGARIRSRWCGLGTVYGLGLALLLIHI